MVNKSVILSLIILTIISASCTAVEVFDGEIKQDVETNAGGKNVSLRYYSANDKVSLNIIDDSKYLLIGRGECAKSGLWEYCFDGADEREEEVNVSGKLLLKTFYYADMRVSKQAPVIELAVTTSATEMELDKRFDINIRLTNTGDLDADNIDFEMELPDNVSVVSTTAALAGNRLVWSTPLNKDDSRDKKVTLVLTDFGEYDFDGIATYMSAGTEARDTDSVTIEAKRPYRTNTTVTPELAIANEVVEYKLVIENDASDIMDIKELEITVPPQLDIKRLPFGFAISKNILKGSDQISPGSSKEYIIRGQTLHEGDYEMRTGLDMEVGNRRFKEDFINEFGVGVSGIVPIINISDLSPRTYDPLNITIYLYNRDVNNITTEASIKSDLFSEVTTDALNHNPKSTREIFDKTITVPKTEDERSAYIEVSGTYIDSRDNKVNYHKREDFRILPEEKVVKVTQEADLINDTVTLTVFVENLKDVELPSVEVFDLLPKGFKVTAGAQTKTVSLNRTEKSMVLDYKIKVPENYTKDSFLIEHTVNIEDSEGAFFIQEISLRVDLRRQTYEATESSNGTRAENTTGEENPSTATEDAEKERLNFTAVEEGEKKGIFAKIWDNIKGIFRTIFGKE